MRQASPSFFNTIRGPHKMYVRARVCTPYQTGTDPVGVDIPIVSGSVTYDGTADITGSLDLTTYYDWPRYASSTGTPYGQEIFVERGVYYANGLAESVGLGYFRINDISQDEPGGLINISATDRMSVLSDAILPRPIPYGAGASVQGVIDNLLQDVMPTLSGVYDWSAGTSLLTVQHIATDDRLGFMLDLANSYAKTMYFGYDGNLYIKSRPDPTKGSVFTVNHGRYGVLASIKRGLSRGSVYNAVFATGQPPGQQDPVQGEAYDLNPNSPTYYGGQFGKVPRKFSSTFLSTNDQCVAAAQSILIGSTGLPYTVSLGVVPNPALEVGDVITVTYSDDATIETHIIDKITIPLTTDGLMTIETRKQYL